MSMVLALFVIASFSGCDNGPHNTYQGYIEGEYLYISSPAGGKVIRRHVNKGDRVEKDIPLFELDPEPERSQYLEAKGRLQAAEALLRDKIKGLRPAELAAIEANIDRAEAALALSSKEFERARALRDKHAISAERYDEAESAYNRDTAAAAEAREKLKIAKLGARSDQIEAARKDRERAKATMDQASWRLDQKKGIAPGPALVTDVLYQAGEYVPPGYPIVVLLPPKKVKARFFVPEERLSSLSPGQTVAVTIDGLDRPIEGRIGYISPKAEYTPPFIYSKDQRKKLVFMVEVSFSEEDARNLHPGQPVEVSLES
jgi:HlyD family secretion protein